MSLGVGGAANNVGYLYSGPTPSRRDEYNARGGRPPRSRHRADTSRPTGGDASETPSTQHQVRHHESDSECVDVNLLALVRARERVGEGVGRGGTYVGDRARPVFLTSWEMLSRSSAVLVRRLKVVRGAAVTVAARAGAGVANRVLQEAADGAVTVPRALLPAIVRRRRRRRRARRGLARRGRHVVRIGMGLALMVQIDAINDRVVLVACAQ